METLDKNLLITLGDSWTYGVGCYIPELLDQRGNPTIPAEEIYIKSAHRFKEYGWPNLCSKTLEYELINLGSGGAANSALAKMLLDNKQYKDLKKVYNRVVLVFLLSDPIRFSYYNNNILSSYTTRAPTIKENNLSVHNWDSFTGLESFLDWYVNNVNVTDASKETAFYLRTVEYFCKYYEYDFYWGTAFTDVEEILPYYDNHDACLHNKQFSCFRQYIFDTLNTSAFSYCHHPNERGYRLIGEFITDKIKL